MLSLRTKLTKQLEKIAGLEKTVMLGKHEGFTYFSFKGKEIAHFDNDNELDLRLTKKIIKSEGLIHPVDSKNHPKRAKTQPHWIVLQFKRETRIKEIIGLVKLAIQQI